MTTRQEVSTNFVHKHNLLSTFFWGGGFIIPAELSSTCYTTTEVPIIAHHAKLGGLHLAPKGPAIQGGALPIKEKKGRGVNTANIRG